MVREDWKKELQAILGKKELLENAPMSRYTTLRLGGPAELLCEISSEEALSRALAWAKAHEIPVTVIGNGSNLLVKDGGIRGLVLHIGQSLAKISRPVALPDGRFALTAQGGALLCDFAQAAASHSLAGLEFASGIPGTVGGAVYMNAGAYGGEMKDVVAAVTAYDYAGKRWEFSTDELLLGYRQSRFSTQEPAVVTSVTVALSLGEEETIRAAMRELEARRREKQPLDQPSCGSTFKRPPDRFTGPLIEQCGLKGCRVGGVSVSQLHAGFLVNDQEGSAADFLALISRVQREVLEKTGVQLQPEVRILGEDAPAKEV